MTPSTFSSSASRTISICSSCASARAAKVLRRACSTRQQSNTNTNLKPKPRTGPCGRRPRKAAGSLPCPQPCQSWGVEASGLGGCAGAFLKHLRSARDDHQGSSTRVGPAIDEDTTTAINCEPCSSFPLPLAPPAS